VQKKSLWSLVFIVISLLILVPILVWLFGLVQTKKAENLQSMEFNRGMGDNGDMDYVDPLAFKEILKQLKAQTIATEKAFQKVSKDGEDIIIES